MSIQDLAVIIGLAIGALLIVGTFRAFGKGEKLGMTGGAFLTVGIVLFGLSLAGSVEFWIGTGGTLQARLESLEQSMARAEENDRHLREAIDKVGWVIEETTSFLLISEPQGEERGLEVEADRLHQRIREAEAELRQVQALATREFPPSAE
jgi:hypothetical protein